jgi:hypothetical protein
MNNINIFKIQREQINVLLLFMYSFLYQITFDTGYKYKINLIILVLNNPILVQV